MYRKDINDGGRSRFAVLGLLSIRPMSGYDMKRTVEQSLAHFWRESYGSIYPILRRLEADKLVERRAEKGSRAAERFVYTLTPEGWAEFERWLPEPPEQEPPIRSELLLKLFFGNHLPREKVRPLLEAYGEEQRQREERLREAEKEIDESRSDPGAFFWRLTLRRGLLVTRARARWAKESIAAIDSLEERPARRPPSRARKNPPPRRPSR
jgi:PadR family transcriptional regulator AphA